MFPQKVQQENLGCLHHSRIQHSIEHSKVALNNLKNHSFFSFLVCVCVHIHLVLGVHHKTLINSPFFLGKSQFLPDFIAAKCHASCRFSHAFDGNLAGVEFPSTLRSVKFGDKFNQLLDDSQILPRWVETNNKLEVSKDFDHNLGF